MRRIIVRGLNADLSIARAIDAAEQAESAASTAAADAAAGVAAATSADRTAAQSARAGAEAARDDAEALVISDLGTTDGQTRALIEAPASQTAQALTATVATGVEDGIQSSAYLPAAFVSRNELASLADPEAVAQYVVESAVTDLGFPLVEDADDLADGEYGIRVEDESDYLLRWNADGLTSPIAGATPTPLPDYLGFAFAVVYENPTTGDRTIEYGVRFDGTIYSATSGATASGPDIFIPGDSLQAGAGGGGVTPSNVLQGLLSAAGSAAVVRNGGVGGEDSPTITARTNAKPLVMLVTGGSVPASGPVDVTLQPIDGEPVEPLIQGDGGGTSGTLWTENGPVAGSISLASGTYKFTRTNPGSAVTCARPSAFRYDFGEARRGDIYVIAMGQNPGSTGNDARAISDAQAIIREMKALDKRWLVLSRPSTNDAQDALYDTAFGRRHIAVRKYLVTYGLADAGITPTSGDNDDIAAGIVPRSLRSDSVHGTAAYYTIVGKLIHRRLNELEFI